MRKVIWFFGLFWLLSFSACYLDAESQCLSDRDCVGGQRCDGKVCVCSSGQTFCTNLCVDINKDANHCGACGKACPKDQSCMDGICQPGKAVCTLQSCQTNDDCAICEGDQKCVLIGGAAGFCRPSGTKVCPSSCLKDEECEPCGQGVKCSIFPPAGGFCQ